MKVKSYVLANESHQLLNRLSGTIAASRFHFLRILLTYLTALTTFFKTDLSIAQYFSVWRNWGKFSRDKFSFFFSSQVDVIVAIPLHLLLVAVKVCKIIPKLNQFVVLYDKYQYSLHKTFIDEIFWFHCLKCNWPFSAVFSSCKNQADHNYLVSLVYH